MLRKKSTAAIFIWAYSSLITNILKHANILYTNKNEEIKYTGKESITYFPSHPMISIPYFRLTHSLAFDDFLYIMWPQARRGKPFANQIARKNFKI